ncbi:hypothetical protein GCM10010156_78290 [Planobispora rosea]|uniref:Uncharacterized protein n=1 Tax=Planobispora rosea TaxID=35762 RepID=A0A8J3WHD2_PLARO|nr:hypothetical protein [Planobispora rosea]GGT10527.1 hypothetical protein GCM10010156_78290 [Planobispora rosea]GIH89360.1 hypothetical protein Pro02_77680 [Planobispora rosea]
MGGFIYAIAFDSGILKVGQGIDALRRIGNHRRNAAFHGVGVVNEWVSPPHVEYAANERKLIEFCSTRGIREGNGRSEHFTSLDFATVTAFAQSLPMTPSHTSTAAVIDKGLILDASVLTALARQDATTIIMVQQLNNGQIQLVVPSLTAAEALLRAGGRAEQAALLQGLQRLKMTTVGEYGDILDVVTVAGDLNCQSLGDAQAVCEACRYQYPILTLDRGHWEKVIRETSDAFTVTAVSDSDDQERIRSGVRS